VIPKTPEKDPEKPKPKPEPKPDPKPRVEPKPAPKEVAKTEPPKPAPPKPPPPKPAPKPQESYDDLLADLRAERGESRPDRVERPTRTANAAKPGAGGTAPTPGVRASGTASVTPEVAAWLRAARLHVRQAWVLPAGFRREPLETQVEVELDSRGNVLSEPKVVRRSGNPWYDESVVRAVQKASPLPPPPEPGKWPFVFKPEDLG
jgi:TonB family protein